MTGFRVMLCLMFSTVVLYTVAVAADHGMNLLPVFFGDIARVQWPGQFNLDFLGFLVLSGFWLAWRHDFSPAGIALGVLGVFGGTPLLAAYLLVVSFRTGGDVRVMLLGERRVFGAARPSAAEPQDPSP